MDEGRFELYDIYKASWLTLHGVSIDLDKRGSRVVFLIPNSEEVSKLLRRYSEDPQISLLGYVQALRRTRARMLDARQGDAGRDDDGQGVGHGRN